jgi:predicted AAA+ superfamily ATPase
MTTIKEGLDDFNPWWKEEFEIEFKERRIYEQIKKFRPMRQIIAFTGLRRVGKTTLMFKIVKDAISNKEYNSQDIIYFSFDRFKEVEIREIIKEYENKTNKDAKKGKYLLLLDEVQKLKDWENQIKSIYDIYGRSIKMIISGSESLFIKKKSKETLAGRIFEFKVEPLSFKEFLSFKNINLQPIGIYEREYSKLFEEFILTLGFPELIGVSDKEVTEKYIKEIIDKIIYQDIPRLFKIKDINIIESLLNIFLEEPGQLVELSSLAQDLNLSRQTLSEYLSYLEESFLIKKVYNFSRSRRKVERKLKKYYPTIVSANLLFKEDVLYKSRIFEWMLINQLKAEFFWRDPYKHEVDAVLIDKKITPIEIKYGRIDFEGLIAFMNKFKLEEGYILSNKEEREQKIDNKIIKIIPAWKWLLKN